MLRKHLDHAINDAVQNTHFEPITAEVLFGFTTTFISMLLIIIIAILIYSSVTKHNIIKIMYDDLEEAKYLLPLYYSRRDRYKNWNKKYKQEQEEEEPTEKPTLDFVIPAIQTDHITLNTPASPAMSLDSVSSIKRRISPFKQENN